MLTAMNHRPLKSMIEPNSDSFSSTISSHVFFLPCSFGLTLIAGAVGSNGPFHFSFPFPFQALASIVVLVGVVGLVKALPLFGIIAAALPLDPVKMGAAAPREENGAVDDFDDFPHLEGGGDLVV